MNKSIKIFLNWFLGPILFLWLSWSVYNQLQHQPDLDRHLQQIRDTLGGGSNHLLLAVLLLMPLNWGLESRKWQLLIRHTHNLGYGQSFKAILSGVAFSLNTPNRIGEYGGRVLFLPEGKRGQGVSLTIVGSFSQLLVTLCMGAAGMMYMHEPIIAATGSENSRIWVNVFLMGVLAVSVSGLLVYFRMSWLIRGVEMIPGVRRIVRYLSILEAMHVTILLRVLSLSLLRFVVFVIQYNLMLRAMHVDMGWWEGFWAVSVLFLLLATLPTVALLELGLRWEYSIMLFGIYSSNTVGIYAAATGIWLINLVIPALAGSLFMLGLRIFRNP